MLKEKQTLDKQKQDKLITTLSGTLTTAVNAKLDKLVKAEMKNNVLPGKLYHRHWYLRAHAYDC